MVKLVMLKQLYVMHICHLPGCSLSLRFCVRLLLWNVRSCSLDSLISTFSAERKEQSTFITAFAIVPDGT